MLNGKILLAATLAVSSLAGAANAAPWDRGEHRPGPVAGHEFQRPYVERVRVYDTLRLRHDRGIGDPVFRHGHYVVRSINRFGRTVFVEVDHHSGAFIDEFRI